jgi:hypothetical protein
VYHRTVDLIRALYIGSAHARKRRLPRRMLTAVRLESRDSLDSLGRFPKARSTLSKDDPERGRPPGMTAASSRTQEAK